MALDRLQFAVALHDLIDLLKPQLGCRRQDSPTHACRAMLRFRTEPYVHKL